MKTFLLGVLSFLCLMVGVLAIVIERQAYFAEKKVEAWAQSKCLMEELDFHGESFSSHCTYEMNGQRYSVKKQTPVWNQYFNMVSANGGGVEVLFINASGKKFTFRFVKNQQSDFWYDPNHPEDSVLMPSAGSLRSFLYFGVGYNLVLIGALIFGRKRLKKKYPGPERFRA